MTIKELYESAYYSEREDYKVVIAVIGLGWYEDIEYEFDDENKEIILSNK